MCVSTYYYYKYHKNVYFQKVGTQYKLLVPNYLTLNILLFVEMLESPWMSKVLFGVINDCQL